MSPTVKSYATPSMAVNLAIPCTKITSCGYDCGANRRSIQREIKQNIVRGQRGGASVDEVGVGVVENVHVGPVGELAHAETGNALIIDPVVVVEHRRGLGFEASSSTALNSNTSANRNSFMVSSLCSVVLFSFYSSDIFFLFSLFVFLSISFSSGESCPEKRGGGKRRVTHSGLAGCAFAERG